MGLRGRVLATGAIAVVFVFGLYSQLVFVSIVGLPLLAGVLLRSIWKREAIPAFEEPEARVGDPARYRGMTGMRAPVLAGVACSLLVGVVVWGWFLGTTGRKVIVPVGGVLLVVAAAAWLADAT